MSSLFGQLVGIGAVGRFWSWAKPHQDAIFHVFQATAHFQPACHHALNLSTNSPFLPCFCKYCICTLRSRKLLLHPAVQWFNTRLQFTFHNSPSNGLFGHMASELHNSSPPPRDTGCFSVKYATLKWNNFYIPEPIWRRVRFSETRMLGIFFRFLFNQVYGVVSEISWRKGIPDFNIVFNSGLHAFKSNTVNFESMKLQN